jgi:hypothetical protein
MNNDTHIIWEKHQKRQTLLENSDLVWDALQEAAQLVEEAKITPDMVNQINSSLGTQLTIDQLGQIQQITNPGMAQAAGSALGKVGGFLKNAVTKGVGAATQAYGAAKDQVTDPNSTLRQGVDKGVDIAKQAGGAIASGVQKGADAVATGAQAVGQAAGDMAQGAQAGYDSTQEEDPTKRDPKTGQYTKGNQSGVQFAESVLRRPGWNNRKIL